MPIVKEKTKKKRPREESITEQFREEIAEIEAVDVLIRPPGVPSATEARVEDLIILEPPSLQVALPDDMFGEFDAGPTSQITPWTVPPKAPSEVSEKSQLEKIVDQLIAEEYHSTKPKKDVETKSSSNSPDEGPVVVQVEVMVHREADIAPRVEETPQEASSGSPREAPVVMTVEAMVHRSADEGVILASEQPPTLSEALPMEVGEIQTLEEAAIAAEHAKKTEIAVVSEKKIPTKKRAPLRQLQEDEIPTPGSVAPSKLKKEEKARIEKEEKIAKYLRIKFKTPKRILRLDDYNKIISLTTEIPARIFKERDLLQGELNNFLMGTDQMEFESKTIEKMREGSSSTFGSDLQTSKRPTHTTPLDYRESASEVLAADVAPSDYFMEQFHVQTIKSTPIRQIEEIPQKQLFEQPSIPTFQAPMVEEFLEIQPTEKVLPPKKQEDDSRRQSMIETLKNWDENQGYLRIDDVIPEPKIRRNAAKTFFLLLELSKEGLVVVIPKQNSTVVEFVKRGKNWV